MMERTNSQWVAAAACVGLVLCGAGLSRADVVQDSFDTPRDYLTAGVPGTIWEGLYTGCGDVAGGTCNGPGKTLQANASISNPGVLTIQSTETEWEGGDDGFFLYKTVAGDFDMQVRIAAFDVVAYNCMGLMARAANLVDGNPGEDYVTWFRFDEFGIPNYWRIVTGGAVENGWPANFPNTLYYLRMTRTGDTISMYEKGSVPEVWSLAKSVDRLDLAGLPLQVGIMQATFSNNSPTSQMDDFSLEGPGVNPAGEAAAATGLTFTNVTTTGMTLNWTRSPDSDGTVVIMRAAKPITQQPADGFTYAANAAFGTGDNLSSGNFVVYAGSGSSVTVTGLERGKLYYVAAYAYKGAGASTNYTLSDAAAGSRATEVGGAAIIAAGLATEIRTASARLNGELIAEQAPSTVTLFYGPSDAGTNAAGWVSSVDLGPTAVGPFSAPVAGLIANKTYYFRARAANANGEVWSDAVSFTTLVWSVTDTFDTPHDYLANGTAGTIWDGIKANPELVFQANASIGGEGVLTFQSAGTAWAGADNSGMFLYKVLEPGDFTFQVHITSFDPAAFNWCGLMARVDDFNAAGPGEDWLAWCTFDQYGIGSFMRNTDDDAVNAESYQPMTNKHRLMMERVGDTFRLYEKENADDAWELVPGATVVRPDMSGLKIQVGLIQATFSANSPITQFDNFVLDAQGVRPCTQALLFDTDEDLDIDQEDFGVFQACYTGELESMLPPACLCFDRDQDRDVDSQDLLKFVNCVSGPMVPANAACDD